MHIPTKRKEIKHRNENQQQKLFSENFRLWALRCPRTLQLSLVQVKKIRSCRAGCDGMIILIQAGDSKFVTILLCLFYLNLSSAWVFFATVKMFPKLHYIFMLGERFSEATPKAKGRGDTSPTGMLADYVSKQLSSQDSGITSRQNCCCVSFVAFTAVVQARC